MPPLLAGPRLLSGFGLELFQLFFQNVDIMDIELQNIHDVHEELRFLIENERGQLSVIPICNFLPRARSVAFTGISLNDLEQRGDEYMRCIREYIESAASRSLRSIEFRSRYLPEISEFEEIKQSFEERQFDDESEEKESGHLGHRGWGLSFECHSEHYLRINVFERKKNETEQKEEAERLMAQQDEMEANQRELEHELGLNLLSGCKMADQPLFNLNAEQLWQCIGWWIENDVKHRNAFSAMTRVCADYHICGAVLCYVFLEQRKKPEKFPVVIQNLLKTKMRRFWTAKTIEIILEGVWQWMFNDKGELKTATTREAARFMLQIPIKMLKNEIIEKQIDGKRFISDPPDFRMTVQRVTGWSKSECTLLTEVLLRRMSWNNDEILERIQEEANLQRIPTKATKHIFIEDAQYQLQTRGRMPREFCESIMGCLFEENKAQEPDFEAQFEILSSAMMMDGEDEDGTVPNSWICTFCGNLNVIRKCTLCGINHKEAVVVALKQIPTPFLGMESDSKMTEDDIASSAANRRVDLHCAMQKDGNLHPALKRIAQTLKQQKWYCQFIEDAENEEEMIRHYEEHQKWIESLDVAQIEADYEHIQKCHLQNASAPRRSSIFAFFREAVYGADAGAETERKRSIQTEADQDQQEVVEDEDDQKEENQDDDDDKIVKMLNEINLALCYGDRDDERKLMCTNPKSGGGSIREEIHGIVSHDSFMDTLGEAIAIHREWNVELTNTPRAIEYIQKHSILRNQGITVKHVAVILLYLKHSELSLTVFVACLVSVAWLLHHVVTS